MSLVAVIPVASMQAANAALESAGFGPSNFSVAAYGPSGVTFAALHAWPDAAFTAAVSAIAGVTVDTQPGDPVARTAAAIAAKGATWGAQAPMLPTTGNAVAGTLYAYGDGELWQCIQTFSRSTFGAPPATYPALIFRMRVPGQVNPWVQPSAENPYKLKNPFTGLPDEATDGGFTWYVSQADGAGNNVWRPGVFGWTKR